MGIVRLGKMLKRVGALKSHTTRDEDIKDKINANRVYIDFISIVYKIQDAVLKDLNSMLFSMLLIIESQINNVELNLFCDLVKKYLLPQHYVNEICSTINSVQTFDAKINNLKNYITNEYIASFKQYIRTNNVFNKFVYNAIIEFVVDLITNKLISVEYVLIAFDGIPSFSKIQEQRHRRYMKYSFDEFQRQMKTINHTNSTKIREIYDNDNFSSDIKAAIEYVNDNGENGNIQKDIIQHLNTHTITLEVLNEKFGEGEKILMDRIIKDFNDSEIGNKKSFALYSPDGDSVVLCLYIYILTKIQIFNVIKVYSQNPSNEHNNDNQYVSIPLLFSKLIKIIEGFCKREFSQEMMDRICTDCGIILLSMYGNDFIPGIPTIEIGSTWMDLMYIYSQFLNETQNTISYVRENVAKINYDQLKKWFNLCANYEELLALDSWLAEFDSGEKIYKLFGGIFSHRYLIDYRTHANSFRATLYEYAKQNRHFNSVKKMLDNGIVELNKFTTLSGVSYGSIFWENEVKKNVDLYINNILNGKMVQLPKYIYNIKQKNSGINNIESIMHNIDNHILSNRKIDKIPQNVEFIYNGIRRTIPHKQMPITDADIDFFLLELREGKWKEILVAHSYDFGYNMHNNTIVPINIEMKRYQYKFLGVSNTEIKNIVENYLQGISWVFDYYTNSNKMYYSEYISTWAYKYDRAPFINHISNHTNTISKHKINELFENVYNKSLVSTKKYINKQLHRLYIYPLDRSIVNKIEDTYKPSFPDMIYNVSETIKHKKMYFDCRLSPYFSKCLFKSKKLSFDELIKIGCKLNFIQVN